MPAEQGGSNGGGRSRTEPDEANRLKPQGRRFDPVPTHQKCPAQQPAAGTSSLDELQDPWAFLAVGVGDCACLRSGNSSVWPPLGRGHLAPTGQSWG
jgi:hypothetical protein